MKGNGNILRRWAAACCWLALWLAAAACPALAMESEGRLSPPLAEAEGSRLRWELLSLEEAEDGTLDLRMCVENTSKEQEFRDTVRMLMNGWLNNEVYLLLVEPGYKKEMSFSFSNQVLIPWDELETDRGSGEMYPLEDHLLERRSMRELSEICIIAGMNPSAFEGGEEIMLLPEKPIPLADVPETPAEDQLVLLDGEIRIAVNHVLIGETGIAVSLDLINRMTRPVQLTAETPRINGKESRLGGAQQTFDIPGYAGRTVYLVIIPGTEEDPAAAGEKIQEITLSWSALSGSIPDTAFTLLREAQPGPGSAKVFTGADLMCDVSRAKQLLRTSAVLDTDSLIPVDLVPALTEGQARRFESGRAHICLRTEESYDYETVGEDGETIRELLPELGRICSVELTRDEAGRIAGRYSGLAWVNSLNEVIEDSESTDPEEEEAYVLRMTAGVFRNPAAVREIPEEISLEEANPDYILTAEHRISLAGGIPRSTAHRGYAEDREGTDVTETLPESDEPLAAMGEQKVTVLREEYELLTRHEKRPFIRMEDLRLVRADTLEGMLTVQYELNYSDGSSEILTEAYPYE